MPVILHKKCTGSKLTWYYVKIRHLSLSGVIIWVSAVLKRTVFVDIDQCFDNLIGSHLQTHANNIGSFQNYTHMNDHTRRTTDTPGFKPFTVRELKKQEVWWQFKTQATFHRSDVQVTVLTINKRAKRCRPNHNPKWCFSSNGNCLECGCIDSRVPCTCDLWNVTRVLELAEVWHPGHFSPRPLHPFAP